MSSCSDSYDDLDALRDSISSLEPNSYICDSHVDTFHNSFSDGQLEEIKNLTLEIKSLSDQTPFLKKDIQLHNSLFTTQEENLYLKAEIKALKSQQHLSTNNSDHDCDNNYFHKNKMSSLIKSIEELKSLQLESKLTIYLEEYAAILSKIDPPARFVDFESSCIKSESKNNKSSTSSLKSEPRMGVYQITNIKLSKSGKEDVKPMMIVKNIKEKLPISAIFDENAYLSICGPFILNYADKDISLKPPPYIEYKFHSGKVYKCLGSIEINLINSLKKKKI
ncbi:unnamed protein product [Lepeophtheirus salmonis]|uniref:(salmon louse) hypothetical protein n=1 Tax=Lepeophtheirus salmonis TaxID=72036 RepID=A0A7R8H287_LEPSM|nr:unnamed protein product [Lepeophtheirus salmonis]CAF2809331.1 unnamed protein product [Lepeophtheirus salmonis]